MKKTIGRVIKILAWMMIFVFLVNSLGIFVRPQEKDYDVWHYFYKEDNDTLNTLFIGSSAMYRYWIPTQAYEEQNFTSYMLAQSSQDMRTIPYIMEEAVKSQDVDLFVVETRPVVTDRAKILRGIFEQKEETYYLSRVTVGMKASLTRAKLIHDLLVEDEENLEMEWMFPLLKYHDTLLEMTWKDIKKRLFLGKHSYKFARQVSSITPQEQMQYVDEEPYVLTREDKEKIDAIVEKANALEKDVLFIATSYIPTDLRYYLQKDLDDYMEQKQYSYVNLNQKNEIGLDYSTDFYDENHVNIAGARKTTSYLADYLANHYTFHNRLSERQSQEWELAKETWKKKEKKLMKKWKKKCKNTEMQGEAI
ncbi:MAG: hypothetical protein Q4D51_01250 [Eubacteriales bacterium]|nr:hypothetical protein [Eubacteriales bacterium]